MGTAPAPLSKVDEAFSQIGFELERLRREVNQSDLEAIEWKKKYERLLRYIKEKKEWSMSKKKVGDFQPDVEITGEHSCRDLSPLNSLTSREEDSSVYIFRRNASRLCEEYGDIQRDLYSTGEDESFSMSQNDQETKSYKIDKTFNLTWNAKPSKVLIFAKKSTIVHNKLHDLISWLKAKGIDVFIEPSLYHHSDMIEFIMDTKSSDKLDQDQSKKGSISTWMETNGVVPKDILCNIDFVITLGGDGTVLWTSRALGNAPTPPVISFALGSLGFMTPCEFQEMHFTLERVISGSLKLMYRHRLQAFIFRNSGPYSSFDQKNIKISECDQHFHVLNEITIDRGVSPYIINLEAYCDTSYVTNVQGDGLIISTPSGSTAYSLAAGGSICHPEVPAMLLTPICPHSLSFRPIIFPHHVRLALQVPANARAGVTCSFDGKDSLPLYHGDLIIVSMSPWPFRSICNSDTVRDWLSPLSCELYYNKRVQQQDH